MHRTLTFLASAIALTAAPAPVYAAPLSSAAAASDPDMVCLVALAGSAQQAGGNGEDRMAFDRGGGYYLAIVQKRYPTVALFAPVVNMAAQVVSQGDLAAISKTCLDGVQPALDLIVDSLDSLKK